MEYSVYPTGEIGEITPEYVLMDAALWEEDMDRARDLCKEYRSLFRGKAAEELHGVAPFLFAVEKESDFEKWIQRQTNKRQTARRVTWLASDASIDDLRKHLRRFLRVKDESGDFMYFRFYDPLVLPYILPNLTEEQSKEFFSMIHYIKLSRDGFGEEKLYRFSKSACRMDIHIL